MYGQNPWFGSLEGLVYLENRDAYVLLPIMEAALASPLRFAST